MCMNNADSPQAGLPHRTVGRCPHIRVPRDRSARVERCSSKRSLAEGSRWNEQCCIRNCSEETNWSNTLAKLVLTTSHMLAHVYELWDVQSHEELLILVNSIRDLLHTLHEELSRRAEPMELQRLDRETVRMSCVLDMFNEHAWQILTVWLCWTRFRSYLLHLRPTDPLIITKSPLLPFSSIVIA